MGAETSAELQKAPVMPVPVKLHVYDLGHSDEMRAVNSVLGAVGTGAFHCGVEVYGLEWSFQSTPRGSGVFSCPPQRCQSHSFRTSVAMGFTRLSEKEVLRLLELLRRDWHGGTYDMLTRNCCHFSDEFCRRLGVGPIPFWTTSLADAGASVKAAYDVAVDSLYPTLLTGCFSGRQHQQQKPVMRGPVAVA